MKVFSWRVCVIVALILLVGILVLERGIPFLASQHVAGADRHEISVSAHAVVSIPRGQDLFMPFILPVTVNTEVTWKNEDTARHSIATTPDYESFLNPVSFSFTLNAGESASMVFSRPGLYHYYETAEDTWNPTYSRVAANSGLRHYPLAMDGVIWVEGSIAGLPSSVFNYILHGHDMFATEFVAITRSGSVTWHNLDEDAHFVGLVAGWSTPVNPIDIGLYRLAGTDDLPGGQSVTVLFPTPGLYYYYCRNHDRVDQATHRARALTMASEYPIPMEGFVLVV